MSSSQVDSFAAAASSDNVNRSKSQNNEATEEILQLPPSDTNNSDVQTLQMGQSIKLDDLGPIIINTDGTTRRIDNWATLTEHEKKVTWRRIRKRNAERREALEAKQKEQESLENES